MKTLFNTFLLLCFIFTLNACSTTAKEDSLNLSTKEDIQKCIERAKEKFNGTKEFHELIFYTDVNKECELEIISLEIIDKLKTYLTLTGDVTESDPITISDEEVSLASFDAIDCNYVIEKFNEAKDKIKNKTDEFENFKLKELGIEVNTSNQLEYSLELLAYQKEVKPTIYGDRMSVKDPKFTFDVAINEDGSVIVDTIDE